MSLLTNKLDTKAVYTQTFYARILNEKNISLDVLRLDAIHPVISGNKLFKLARYIDDAFAQQCTTIETFGGFYSNHIAATAYAAKLCGFQSLGIVRGNHPKVLTPTLCEAEKNGMQLHFVSTADYEERKRRMQISNSVYTIPEGGYGDLGANGAASIPLLTPNFESYDHVVSAVGTGTTAAGLIQSLLSGQKFLGISALKNAHSLENEIRSLLPEKEYSFEINHDYHFGGFAKHPPELIEFMNKVWIENNLPTDIVYTSKTLYGILDLASKDYFSQGSNILLVHTGGLQGNRSLPANSLPFL